MRNNKTIAQPIRHLTTQPMRNHCTCNSQFPPMNFPLLLQDSPLSLASPGLPVARHSCVPNVVLRHPQINPFCWKKTTDCFKLWIPFMTPKNPTVFSGTKRSWNVQDPPKENHASYESHKGYLDKWSCAMSPEEIFQNPKDVVFSLPTWCSGKEPAC